MTIDNGVDVEVHGTTVQIIVVVDPGKWSKNTASFVFTHDCGHIGEALLVAGHIASVLRAFGPGPVTVPE
ncbi:MAG: hypothetical protein FJ279_02110 [Planctomycetes bacterium]|nr:hypothetical protein [Planctomycetota bacterium]